MDDALRAAGLAPAGIPNPQIKITWSPSDLIGEYGASKRFPDLVFRIEYEARLGEPAELHYQISGPIDQVEAFGREWAARQSKKPQP